MQTINSPVYLNRISSFLPNSPVSNDDMELYLGMVDGEPSKVKPIILRQNGIKNRYYALTKNQEITHTNVDLAKCAIEKLGFSKEELRKIQFLSCGTSMPDQYLPSHAAMVHGAVFDHPLEISSLAGVCMSGLMAFKVAYMSILSGNSQNAISVASELISPTMLAKFFTEEIKHKKEIGENPYLAFEKDFLRFMLSDGAAAMYLSNTREADCCFTIEWIRTFSYANKQPACMYMWAEKENDGTLRGWKTFNAKDIEKKSVWSLKQDVRQLNKYGMTLFVDAVETSLAQAGIDTDDITYVVPHLSSMFFYKILEQEFQKRNIDLPTTKWFTNLSSVGNIGAASPFVALNGLIETKCLKKGDTILLIVPESGRFSCGTALLKYV